MFQCCAAVFALSNNASSSNHSTFANHHIPVAAYGHDFIGSGAR